MATIFLVGFMGAGKTSIGRTLAAYLQYNFIDLDDLIVKESKLTINEIFTQYGEPYFRKLETNILNNIANYQNTVVSLGGGAYITEENRHIIKKYGISIWLQCDLPTILFRLTNNTTRPLHRSKEQMETLLSSRLPFYQQTDFHIDVTNLTIENAVTAIQQLINNKSY